MLSRAGLQVEADLELVGVTAIEDKLQAGVPEAIQTLLDAGVKARARAPARAGGLSLAGPGRPRACSALSSCCLNPVAGRRSLHQQLMPACRVCFPPLSLL